MGKDAKINVSSYNCSEHFSFNELATMTSPCDPDNFEWAALMKPADVRRLLGCIASRLEELSEPMVRVPTKKDVYHGLFAGAESAMTIEIMIGQVVLPLVIPEGLSNMAPGRLADLVVERVSDITRHKAHYFDTFSRLQSSITAKLERDGLGMRLIGLKVMRRVVTDCSVRRRIMWRAWIERLDHALRPHGDWAEASTSREFAQIINVIGRDQRERLKAVTRLSRSGAVLEIDRIAERAIERAGKSVSEAVADLTDEERRFTSGQFPLLRLPSMKWEVAISVENGRIGCDIAFADAARLQGNILVINRALPEIITTTLVSRLATDVLACDLLENISIVAAAVGDDGSTRLRFDVPCRPIPRSEVA